MLRRLRSCRALTRRLAFNLLLRDRREDPGNHLAGVGASVDAVGRGDDRGVRRLASFDDVLEFGRSTEQTVHVAGNDDVELTGVDAGHHRDELRPRLPGERRNIVVDELGRDSPAAGRDQPLAVVALAVNTELFAGSILALTEVDSGSHVS